MSSNEKIIIFIAAVSIVAIIFYLFKKEKYSAPTLQACRVSTVTDQSSAFTAQAATMLANADAATIATYNAALQNYQSKLAAYNNLPMCAGSSCMGGTVNSDGFCVCPATAPVAYSNNGIAYCVPNDFTTAINNKTMVFNAGTFSCAPGYSQNIQGDNNCYNQANQLALANFTKTINDASAGFAKKSALAGAYGAMVTVQGTYYIAGQSNIPTGLTKVGTLSGITITADCVNKMPPYGANAIMPTVFTYNPQTGICDYYSGTVSFATLPTGSLTVGTITP
jgi:hypothetical protein